ncbi:MAG: acyl carrier protein [Oscillospiraceae bacterium]|nr:acyl carrier protein [Oscillospiraceae bacterium]
MLERVIGILREYSEAEEITRDSVLVSDLGLTSFDVISIVAAFEEEFDIEVPDRAIMDFVTVGDIVTYLEEQA